MKLHAHTHTSKHMAIIDVQGDNIRVTGRGSEYTKSWKNQELHIVIESYQVSLSLSLSLWSYQHHMFHNPIVGSIIQSLASSCPPPLHPSPSLSSHRPDNRYLCKKPCGVLGIWARAVSSRQVVLNQWEVYWQYNQCNVQDLLIGYPHQGCN